MSIIGNDACPRDHCMTCAFKNISPLSKADIHYTWKCRIMRHKKAPKQAVLLTSDKATDILISFKKAAKIGDNSILDHPDHFSKTFIGRFKYLVDKSYETENIQEFIKLREEIIDIVLDENDRRRERPGVG